ncbi:AraC family transcriptional regulator [Vibrio quintilis]|uniref:Urease operon transcriptional activator n=1 Tax=Vibrio quintilis TaxID=1117707 RepID=A0A1M7Z2Z3_9VIBR|nr:helix-turn-helix transcriptional regulator [Vibrio quintilis]SHO59327.1 Urease operon transcriptional activator [Vibrio quintilis]
MFYQTEQLKNPVHAIRHTYQHGITEPEHQHQVIQLLHILNGVIRVYMQGTCRVIPPSRGLLIPAGVPHRLVAVGGVDVRALFIDPLARADVIHEPGIFQVSPLLRELINTASEFAGEIDAGSREERIHELILDELRLIHLTGFNVAMPASQALKQFCERIAAHPERPWELADVAASLNVSARTISRKFHAETGMSFGEWLRRFRLLRSMELMASGYSVTDAAIAVGYDSHSSFSLMFKQRVGMSPKSFVASPA